MKVKMGEVSATLLSLWRGVMRAKAEIACLDALLDSAKKRADKLRDDVEKEARHCGLCGLCALDEKAVPADECQAH